MSISVDADPCNQYEGISGGPSSAAFVLSQAARSRMILKSPRNTAPGSPRFPPHVSTMRSIKAPCDRHRRVAVLRTIQRLGEPRRLALAHARDVRVDVREGPAAPGATGLH